MCQNRVRDRGMRKPRGAGQAGAMAPALFGGRFAVLALLAALIACSGGVAPVVLSPPAAPLTSTPVTAATPIAAPTGAVASGAPGPTNPPSTATAAPAAVPQVVVTRDNERSPTGCSPREVAEVLLRFFDAFNRGDQQGLTRFFDPEFEWYSVTAASSGNDRGSHFVTANRDALLAYFARRHEQHERLRLRALRVSGASWHGGVDFNYVLWRDAEDLAPELGGAERIAEGKGAIGCPGQKIFVWSMAMNHIAPGQEQEYLDSVRPGCPEPPAGTPPTAVIVCAWE